MLCNRKLHEGELGKVCVPCLSITIEELRSDKQALLKLLETYQLVFSDINLEDLHWIDWKRIDKAEKEYSNHLKGE